MFTLGLFLFSGAALIELPQTDDTKAPAQEELVLDGVTAKGVVPTEDAPQTGTLLIRPVLIARNKRRSITQLRRIVLVFKPIEELADGNIKIYTEQNKEEYNITLIPPFQIDPAETRIKHKVDLKEFATQSIDLPGGTYTLGEVHYHTGFNNAVNTQLSAVSYCLSKGTFAFDIRNGEVGYIGALGITDLPANIGKASDHNPIAALDQNPALQNKYNAEEKNIIPVAVDGINFEEEGDVCTGKAHTVAGWKSQSE